MSSKDQKIWYNAYTRDTIKLMLESTTKKRTKALIYFFTSTGCRVSALTDLKMKDLEQMPNGSKAVIFYSGDMAEYIRFLTPEACQALENYLGLFHDFYMATNNIKMQLF